MANGRNPRSRVDAGRDAGGFVALPWSVLDCRAWANLGHPARSLLLELARQLSFDNNGRLLASRAYLLPRGWRSADVIDRAKRELIEAGFIHETVTGHRPNKASWYAVTWRTLNRLPGFDPGAHESFVRGAYQKNASLSPSRGPSRPSIAPSHGAGAPASSPSPGAIRAGLGKTSVPSRGHLLERPSAATQTKH